jgi:hypothetical protein
VGGDPDSRSNFANGLFCTSTLFTGKESYAIAKVSRFSLIQIHYPTYHSSTPSDFHTLELIKQFYPSTSPTFYQFPHNEVPERVLDLGCGLEGRWVLEAATHWSKHQTKVTGFDVMNPEEWKVDGEIKKTARFKHGNLFVRFIPHSMSFHLFF